MAQMYHDNKVIEISVTKTTKFNILRNLIYLRQFEK